MRSTRSQRTARCAQRQSCSKTQIWTMRERKVGQDVRMSGRVLVGGVTETPKRHPEWAQETCGDGESFRLTTIATALLGPMEDCPRWKTHKKASARTNPDLRVRVRQLDLVGVAALYKRNKKRKRQCLPSGKTGNKSNNSPNTLKKSPADQ